MAYVLTGVLLWWPVLQDAPHDLPSARRAVYLFAAFILASPVSSLLLTLLPEPIYEFYEEARASGRLCARGPADRGALMSASEAVVFAAFAFFVARFFAEEG